MKDKRYTAKEVINILEEQMDYDEYQKVLSKYIN